MYHFDRFVVAVWTSGEVLKPREDANIKVPHKDGTKCDNERSISLVANSKLLKIVAKRPGSSYEDARISLKNNTDFGVRDKPPM